MAKQLLHHLELGPHTSQQSRVCVPERVPSESLLNSNPLRHRTNIFPQDRLAPDRSSTSVALARKDPVVGLGVAGTSLPVQQGFGEHRMNGYGPLRRLGLARTDYSIHDGAGDVHVSLRKVDVTPFQAEHFALSQAGRGCKQNQRPFSNV